jgi:hypothetical protein
MFEPVEAWMTMDNPYQPWHPAKYPRLKREIVGVAWLPDRLRIDIAEGGVQTPTVAVSFGKVRAYQGLDEGYRPPAFWRARIERTDRGLEVELTSPLRKSSHTQMDPPLSRFTGDWRTHTWPLFCSYLAYVVAKTDGTHWNPVAYHHYNATESSANSVDAWAIGVSVAVEAVTSLITLESPEGESKKLSDFRKAICEFVAGLPLYADFAPRITGLLNSMNKKRPQDVLHALAKKGRVEENYMLTWAFIGNILWS